MKKLFIRTRKLNSSPVIVHDWSKNILLGLIKLHFLIEDRRPDLVYYPYKYKNFLIVDILWGWDSYHWTFRTSDNYSYLPFMKIKVTFEGENNAKN